MYQRVWAHHIMYTAPQSSYPHDRKLIYLFISFFTATYLQTFRPPNIAGDDYEHAAKPYPS